MYIIHTYIMLYIYIYVYVMAALPRGEALGLARRSGLDEAKRALARKRLPPGRVQDDDVRLCCIMLCCYV